MKTPFQVGDRVRVYDSAGVNDGVVETVCDGFLHITVYGFRTLKAHTKQCRRLIKRRRREFWIERWVHSADEGTQSYEYAVHEGEPKKMDGTHELFRVREVGK